MASSRCTPTRRRPGTQRRQTGGVLDGESKGASTSIRMSTPGWIHAGGAGFFEVRVACSSLTTTKCHGPCAGLPLGSEIRTRAPRVYPMCGTTKFLAASTWNNSAGAGAGSGVAPRETAVAAWGRELRLPAPSATRPTRSSGPIDPPADRRMPSDLDLEFVLSELVADSREYCSSHGHLLVARTLQQRGTPDPA